MKLNHSIITFVILLILLIKTTSASLIINEIMYNPPDKFDDDLEWIEIYNNSTESINLSTWKLDREDIGNSILAPKSYIVIAREIIDDDNDGMSFEALYGNNDSIWNSDDIINAVEASIVLNNDFDTVNLSDGNSTYSAVYNNSIGGNNNGKTLEFLNGRFLESMKMFGTPGNENSNTEDNNTKINISSGVKLSIILDSIIYRNTKYTSIFRIDNLGDIEGVNDNINLTISYEVIGITRNTAELINLNSYISSNTGMLIINITGNFTLCGNITNLTIIDKDNEDNSVCKNFTVIDSEEIFCDIKSSIKTEKEIYSEETIEFYNILSQDNFPFTIEYWIEDVFGNVIKEKINTTNTNKKQFTPNIDEKVIALIIKNKVYPECNDINLTNNNAEKLVIVTNNEISGQFEEDSKIEIEDVIYDDEITNGDIIKVKLKIYKGNTGKKSLKLWAEGSGKISEITSLNLEDKFREYDVTLPIRLKDDCKIQSGRYNVIVEGLDVREKERIRLEFKACKKEIAKTSINNEENKTKKVSQIKKVSEKKSTANNETLTQLNPRTIYHSPGKSKNERIKDTIPWLIAGITTIISVVLIWKR